MFAMDQNQNNNYGGYSYTGGAPIHKQPSTLTAEEYNRLVKQENPFSLALTEVEVLRAICNHRTPDGLGDTLLATSNGQMKCQVCGYEFIPLDSTEIDKEGIVASTKVIIDILQTIKLLFVDMPTEVHREYFQIIPLIEKIPALFDLATKNFQKYETNNGWNYRNSNMGTMNLFQMLSSALTGAGQPQPNPTGPNPYANQFGTWGTGPSANPAYSMFGGGQPYTPDTTDYKLSPEVKAIDPATDKNMVNTSATFKV